MTEEEWSVTRIGHITGSKLHAVCSKTTKGIYRADRKKYMMQLVTERLTGLQTEVYKSKSMSRGTEEEVDSFCEYMFTAGISMQAGDFTFFKHPTIEWFGASPDGYNPELLKGLELKNRDSDNHLEFLLDPVVPEDAFYQCYAGMMCLGYNSWDYVSHDSRFIEEKHRIKIVTVTRDNSIVAEIESEVKAFLAELDEMLNKLKGESNVRQSVW